jgi:hypothetical protein
MKLMISIASILLLVGCSSMNKTYQSQGIIYSKMSDIQFALIKSKLGINDQTQSQIVIADPSSLRIGNVDNVISGALLKNGISTISPDEFTKLTEDQTKKCILVEWGISGRNARSGGYSQEVTVLIKNASSKEMVYQGTGEYYGQTEVDDLRGALLAALKEFKLGN